MALPQQHNLEARETRHLIAADKVEGTTVYNRTGDKLGRIESVVLDKMSGKVAYAVLSFGGFLGIGDKHYPLPWGMLKYDTNLGGYAVDLDKKVLEGAPSYAVDQPVDLTDVAWSQRVHNYYKVPPYWI
jgi:sporulation protein YlmC with PRC-barrel domain